MTHDEARHLLAEVLGHPLGPGFDACTGVAATCPIDECMLCGVRECPGQEPLHFHHDGCPYCEGAPEERPITE